MSSVETAARVASPVALLVADVSGAATGASPTTSPSSGIGAADDDGSGDKPSDPSGDAFMALLAAMMTPTSTALPLPVSSSAPSATGTIAPERDDVKGAAPMTVTVAVESRPGVLGPIRAAGDGTGVAPPASPIGSGSGPRGSSGGDVSWTPNAVAGLVRLSAEPALQRPAAPPVTSLEESLSVPPSALPSVAPSEKLPSVPASVGPPKESPSEELPSVPPFIAPLEELPSVATGVVASSVAPAPPPSLTHVATPTPAAPPAVPAPTVATPETLTASGGAPLPLDQPVAPSSIRPSINLATPVVPTVAETVAPLPVPPDAPVIVEQMTVGPALIATRRNSATRADGDTSLTSTPTRHDSAPVPVLTAETGAPTVLPSVAPTPVAAPTTSATVAADGADELPPVRTSADLCDRVVTMAERVRSTDGLHRFRLVMHPGDLGAVAVELTVDGAVVHVDMVAERAATGELLRSACGELRTSLAAVGLQPGRLDVNERRAHAFGDHGDLGGTSSHASSLDSGGRDRNSGNGSPFGPGRQSSSENPAYSSHGSHRRHSARSAFAASEQRNGGATAPVDRNALATKPTRFDHRRIDVQL